MQDKLARLSAMPNVRGRASLLCPRNTQREARGHGAWSLNKRTAFHRSPWIHPTGDTCLRGFPSGDYFIGFQF